VGFVFFSFFFDIFRHSKQAKPVGIVIEADLLQEHLQQRLEAMSLLAETAKFDDSFYRERDLAQCQSLLEDFN